MKNRKATYYILGSILCVLAIVFIIFAFTHPELSFPWPNWVSYTLYGLYVVFTILVFFIPRIKK